MVRGLSQSYTPTGVLNSTLKQTSFCIHQKFKGDLSGAISTSCHRSGRLTIQALPAHMGVFQIGRCYGRIKSVCLDMIELSYGQYSSIELQYGEQWNVRMGIRYSEIYGGPEGRPSRTFPRDYSLPHHASRTFPHNCYVPHRASRTFPRDCSVPRRALRMFPRQRFPANVLS